MFACCFAVPTIAVKKPYKPLRTIRGLHQNFFQSQDRIFTHRLLSSSILKIAPTKKTANVSKAKKAALKKAAVKKEATKKAKVTKFTTSIPHQTRPKKAAEYPLKSMAGSRNLKRPSQ